MKDYKQHAAEKSAGNSDISSPKHCLNCGALLTGSYCSACGQKDVELHESFWHLLAHFTGDFFHFDSKFFRTMIPLMVKPGFLTNEYIRGKRASYMKPVQLYIFVSVVFFLIYFSFFSTHLINPTDVHENPAALLSDSALKKDSLLIARLKAMPIPDAEQVIDSLNRLSVNSVLDSVLDQSESPISVRSGNQQPNVVRFTVNDAENLPKTVEAYKDSINKLPKDRRPGLIRQAIDIKTIEIDQRRREEGTASLLEALQENFMHNIPKLMFLLLPFFALILKLLYVRKNVYLVDHAIFTLHFHSFLFLLLLLLAFINLIPGVHLGFLYFFLLMSIYLIFAMRKVYSQSWVKTISKVFATYFLYTLALTIVVVVGLMISAASL